MPYVVRKCDNAEWRYGRNDWYDVKVTHDREDAISYVRGEMYLLYASDPDLTSEDIDRHMNTYYGVPKAGEYIVRRMECGHGSTRFAIVNSSAAKYDAPMPTRPDRTELLDAILGTR